MLCFAYVLSGIIEFISEEYVSYLNYLLSWKKERDGIKQINFALYIVQNIYPIFLGLAVKPVCPFFGRLFMMGLAKSVSHL